MTYLRSLGSALNGPDRWCIKTIEQNSNVYMEPQPARTRSGLAYSVATPSLLRGRPEVGTDVSPGLIR